MESKNVLTESFMTNLFVETTSMQKLRNLTEIFILGTIEQVIFLIYLIVINNLRKKDLYIILWYKYK